ncbi:MAG TPA: hypothetical protein VL122_01240 [Nitrospirota bacterium]|nr:hypothetical protein [Nitrospirota bacterium]
MSKKNERDFNGEAAQQDANPGGPVKFANEIAQVLHIGTKTLSLTIL